MTPPTSSTILAPSYLLPQIINFLLLLCFVFKISFARPAKPHPLCPEFRPHLRRLAACVCVAALRISLSSWQRDASGRSRSRSRSARARGTWAWKWADCRDMSNVVIVVVAAFAAAVNAGPSPRSQQNQVGLRTK